LHSQKENTKFGIIFKFIGFIDYYKRRPYNQKLYDVQYQRVC